MNQVKKTTKVVKKSKIQKTKKTSVSKKTTTKSKSKEDRYVIRLIKDKYKAIKLTSRMKLRTYPKTDGTEGVERKYTEKQVDKYIKKSKEFLWMEPVSYK